MSLTRRGFFALLGIAAVAPKVAQRDGLALFGPDAVAPEPTETWWYMADDAGPSWVKIVRVDPEYGIGDDPPHVCVKFDSGYL